QGSAHRGDGVTAGRLCDRTASDLSSDLRAGDIKPSEILDSCLERIDAVEERVRAFLTLTPDAGHELADATGTRFADREELTGVAGIPLALKDVLATRGITTTCGSKILHNWVPQYDCTPWARLRAAGSVLVGKTNCDEFAMGS